MEISYTRARHLGSQSEQITLSCNVTYGDQALSAFYNLREIACKALNVVPYEHETPPQTPPEDLASSAN